MELSPMYTECRTLVKLAREKSEEALTKKIAETILATAVGFALPEEQAEELYPALADERVAFYCAMIFYDTDWDELNLAIRAQMGLEHCPDAEYNRRGSEIISKWLSREDLQALTDTMYEKVGKPLTEFFQVIDNRIPISKERATSMLAEVFVAVTVGTAFYQLSGQRIADEAWDSLRSFVTELTDVSI